MIWSLRGNRRHVPGRHRRVIANERSAEGPRAMAAAALAALTAAIRAAAARPAHWGWYGWAVDRPALSPCPRRWCTTLACALIAAATMLAVAGAARPATPQAAGDRLALAPLPPGVLWEPLVLNEGASLRAGRIGRPAKRVLRLSDQPMRAGAVAVTGRLRPTTAVKAWADVDLLRQRLRRGKARALVAVSGRDGTSYQAGVLRRPSGRLAWALWVTAPRGAVVRMSVGPAARTGSWHHVELETRWADRRARATLRIDGRAAARTSPLDLAGVTGRRVTLGLGRTSSREETGTLLLRSVGVSTATGGAAKPAPLPTAIRVRPPPRITFWMNADWIVRLSNADLDTWKARGLDGFVMSVGHLEGTGGDPTRWWTGDAALRDSSDSHYAYQRQIKNSGIVARSHARGIKVYAAAYLSNPNFPTNAIGQWFNDGYWTGTVLPAFSHFAAGAKLEGFDGIAFDGEMYDGGTWDWNYSGNPGQSSVRTKVRARGVQGMTTILAAFPNVEIINYRHEFKGGIWDTGGYNNANDSTMVNWWDGMSSVNGYSALRFWDEGYYKGNQFGTHGSKNWQAALQATVTGTRQTFSTSWSNWANAGPKTFISAFAWVDNGNASDEQALSPADVTNQLTVARNLSEDGEFGIFCFRPLHSFNYTPYLSALAAASAED